jgi:hypothetical protein
MADVIKDVLQVLETHAKASALFPNVSIGEPKAAPQSGHCSIYLEEDGPHPEFATTLSGTVDVVVIKCRIYLLMFTDPPKQPEFDISNAARDLRRRVRQEFDLGGNVRNVDPTGLVIRYGHLEVGHTMFRIADLFVPCIIDDDSTWAA